MNQDLDEIKNVLRTISEIGLEINKFFESKGSVITYQDALDDNALANKLGDAVKKYEELLLKYKVEWIKN